MKLHGRVEPPPGGQRLFIYSRIQQIFINMFNTRCVSGTLCCRLWARVLVKETDNKPNKLHAYWIVISDMKVIKWGHEVEQLGLGVSARKGLH